MVEGAVRAARAIVGGIGRLGGMRRLSYPKIGLH